MRAREFGAEDGFAVVLGWVGNWVGPSGLGQSGVAESAALFWAVMRRSGL
jgi:hypothetical protein